MDAGGAGRVIGGGDGLAAGAHPVHAAQAVIQVPAAALSCVRAVYEALPGRFVSAA